MSLDSTGDAERKPHLLIVENDQNDASLIQLALRGVADCGSFFLARNASEARAYLLGSGMYHDRTRYPFPVGIISDFRMEGESGLDLLKWYNEESTMPRIPFVLLTGSASATDFLEASRLGALRAVRKPTDSNAFKSTIVALALLLCKSKGVAGMDSESTFP